MDDEEIVRRAAEIRQRQSRERDARRRDETIQDVGKCFIHQNSFGNSGGDWPVYIKIIGASEEGYPVTLEFQTDVYGQARLAIDHMNSIVESDNRSTNVREISSEVFERALQAMLARIREKMMPAPKPPAPQEPVTGRKLVLKAPPEENKCP